MRNASKFFYYVGLALIVATAIIYLVSIGNGVLSNDATRAMLACKTKMLCYHSIATACCLALSKILDRD